MLGDLRTLCVSIGIFLAMAAQSADPDPVALLKLVEQARNSIHSGRARVEIVRTRPGQKPRRRKLDLTFEGERHRCETLDLTEYSIQISSWPSGRRLYEQKVKEFNNDRKKLVELGLLHAFKPYPLLVHTEEEDLAATYGMYGQADVNIYQSGAARSHHNFDPRTIGLTYSPSVGTSVSECLALAKAKEVKLLGHDTVGDRRAWRVEVAQASGNHRWAQEFWIDAEHRHRVLKYRSNGRTVHSFYDADDTQDPLPIRVREVNRIRGDEESYSIRWMDLNIPIDSSAWTLAGMNLPRGATVSDIRIHRRIGYWNGVEVTEKHVPSGISYRLPADKMLRLIRSDPSDPLALHAAIWILSTEGRTPSEQRKAIEAITGRHLASPDLIDLIPELANSKIREAPEFLSAVIKNNHDGRVQAWCHYALATIRKRYGADEAVSLLRTAREEALKRAEPDQKLVREIDRELKSLGHLP